MTTRSSKIMSNLDDVSSKSKHLYKDVKKQLPDGALPAIGIVSAGCALLATGYLLGRRRSRPLAQLESAVRPGLKKAEQAASGVSTADFSPVFKFLKLWMLYRVAV